MGTFSRVPNQKQRGAMLRHFETAEEDLTAFWLPLTALLALTCWLAAPGPLRGLAAGRAAAPVAFSLETTAFKSGGDIPKKFTCDGSDASPPLSWTASPTGTQSFALIMGDPDAPGGTFTHWVLINLPATARRLPEGTTKDDEIMGGGRQGVNDFGRVGYGGPCPPPGKPHRYFFRLYALDRMLDLKARSTMDDVLRAMQGHVRGQAELMGRYGR